MAQVLKESQRKKILESAKGEFVKNGMEGASMRVIADKAEMTVGNLYRYYKSKEELATAVISPVLNHLSAFDTFMTSGTMEGENLKNMDENALDRVLEAWVDILVEAQAQYKQEMYIIINDEKINEVQSQRLIYLMHQVLLVSKPSFVQTGEQLGMVAGMVAKAMYAGLREGVRQKCEGDMEKEMFRMLMKQYIRHSVSWLKVP